MYVESLKRMRIETHLFKDYADIERWVRQVAVIARRPIIGLSGTAKQDDKGVLVPDGAFDGGAIKAAAFLETERVALGALLSPRLDIKTDGRLLAPE